MRQNNLIKAAVATALFAVAGAAVSDSALNFGSDIVAHPDQYPANPIALHLTTQGGAVYGYASADSGWGYYGDRPDWFVTAMDHYGIQEGTYGSCGGANCYPTGYVGISMTAPGTVNGLTAAAVAPKVNLADAKSMLIKMGNMQGGVFKASNVVTVVLSNGTGVRTAYSNPHTDATATAVCSTNVTLAVVGDDLPIVPGVFNREFALFTYKLNLNSFKCEKGTVAKALGALSAVSIEIRNDQNAVGLYNEYQAYGGTVEFLGISRVSFSK